MRWRGPRLGKGTVLGHKTAKLGAASKRTAGLTLSRRAAAALRRAGAKTVVVNLTTGGTTKQTRVALRRARSSLRPDPARRG